ncbi:MAG: FxLYD domain-containing protein, partial [Candidatus Azambacteria bacterium]|nr:FxLYD domain-containing protein [Candidatus Azambacteria bacterium]
SCIDGVLNQGEEKVDCGGPCMACRVVRFSDVTVETYHLFSAGGAYDAIAQVRNANAQHGTRALAYTFRFFDESKNVIAEKKGTTYLLAGQTRYIVENNIDIKTPAAFVTFIVDSFGTWELQEKLTGQVVLPVFSKKYERVSTTESGFAKVTGTVENQSDYTFSTVDINVVLVDGDKNPIAVGKTELNNVRFHEGRAFVVLFPKEIPLPADIYAEAVTNVLDDANVR